MAWNDNLSGTALAIASCPEARLRVMAGPGTGKSYAMKRRIARIIEVDGVDPSRVLAVTFTRTAAADLKKELHAMGIDRCEEIRAGTLHSFCFQILNKEAVFQHLGRSPRGLVTYTKAGIARFEMTPLIEDLKRNASFGGSREISKRILAYEAAWARLQHEEPGWAQNSGDQEFEDELIEWLTFHSGMLVGELVPQALNYLRTNPVADVLNAFEHIVVDEYQDLNRAEQELIDVLGKGCSLSIVGDVDQSIYSFRHAHPEGIQDFSDRNGGTHDETLDECRRCGRKIVAVSDSVIQRNYSTAGSRLSPMPPPQNEGKVSVLQWLTLQQEAEGIADYVEALIAGDECEAGDVLILSPRRLIAKGIKDALSARDISAHSFYNDKLLEPEQAQLSFNLLQLLVNIEDRVALRYWLGHGSKSFRSGQYHHLREHCENNGGSPSEILEQLQSGVLKVKQTNQLVERWELLNKDLDQLRGLQLDELLEKLFPAGEEWSEPIRELLVEKLDDVDDPAKLLRLLHREITQPEMPASGDFVRLMSLHKSKGLTSKVTIVVGCVNGLIPFIDQRITAPAEQRSAKQEQRRLFYVAMTRAKERLVISSVSSIDPALAYKIGVPVRAGGRTIASRFMGELGSTASTAQAGSAWIQNGFDIDS